MKIFSFLLILFSAFFFPGLVAVVKAKASGRRGPGLWQPIHDALRLFRKGSVYSPVTGPLFRLAPAIYLSTAFTAALVVPAATLGAVISFEGDFLLFTGLLAVGKLFLILAAMDAGSGFEGMGAAREALYSLLAEPAFFLTAGALSLLSDPASFAGFFEALRSQPVLSLPLSAVAAYLLVQVAMIENSRLPVDDPRTHLELTMVHEVMVLDHSGIDLGLVQAGSALKFSLYGALIAGLFIPREAPAWAAGAGFLLTQAAFAAAVGLLESFRARKKLNRNPQFILTLSAVAVVLVFAALVASQKISMDAP